MKPIPWEAAHLLARASKLVYQPGPVVVDGLRDEFGCVEAKFLEAGDTQVLLAVKDERVWVVFRGTRGLAHWISNLKTDGPRKGRLGAVHRGFFEGWEAVKDLLRPELESRVTGNRQLWLGGHSRGGALATVMAGELPDDLQARIELVATFGQPRTGLADFRSGFNRRFGDRFWRFVNHDDLVPRLPPWGYAHVGRLVWFNPEGMPDANAPDRFRSEGPEDEPGAMSESEWQTLVEKIRQAPEADLMRSMVSPDGPEAYGEEGIEPLRLHVPGTESHRISAYIERIKAQIPVSDEITRDETADPAPRPTPIQVAAVPVTRADLTMPEAAAAPSAGPLSLPPFSVHVLWDPESTAAGRCPRIAEAIFRFLGHLPADRTGSSLKPELDKGVGIPVYAGHHFARVREFVKAVEGGGAGGSSTLVVLLLDEMANYVERPFQQLADELIERRHPTPRLRILPVFLDPLGTGHVHDGLLALDGRTLEPDQIARRTGEVASRMLQTLGQRAPSDPRPLHLFVSYVHRDQVATDDLAHRIADSFSRQASTFLDVRTLVAGEDLDSQIEHGIAGSVLVVIRTDSYGTGPYTLAEILAAKRLGLPVVTLQALDKGGARSFSCEGNSISLTCPPHCSGTDLDALVRRCMGVCLQAWLHHVHFHFAAPTWFQRRGMTPEHVLSRPPELLDFAQGPLHEVGSGVVLYPDPPLAEIETRILRRSQRRVRLATPTTLSPEVWRRKPVPPLTGVRVALSLSDSPDQAPDFAHISPRLRGSAENGTLLRHMETTLAYLTLTLVRGGAELGYGGHLEAFGYMPFLSAVVECHKRQTRSGARLLFSYVTPRTRTQNPSPDIKVSFVGPIHGPATQGMLYPGSRFSLDLSEMRWRMAQECEARVLMGGKIVPKLLRLSGDRGYQGRFPGQAEEAFQHLRAAKPVYVIGGFFGAVGMVAEALQGKRPAPGQEANWRQGSNLHNGLCDSFDRHRDGKWGLPDTVDDLWREIAEFGRGTFWGTAGSEGPKWPPNGLTVEENLRLFTSVDADEIAGLVYKGLVATAEHQRATPGQRPPLTVALFHGSITEVADTEAYAVLVLGSARLRGADAALDQKLQGLLQRTLEARAKYFDRIIRLNTDQLGGDYILLDWIPDLSGLREAPVPDQWLVDRVREGIAKIVAKACHHKITSLAVVPFGANLGLSARQSARLIVQGILEAGAWGSLEMLVLCEIDEERHREILGELGAMAKSGSSLRLVELSPGMVRSGPSSVFLQAYRNPGSSQIVQLVRSQRGGAMVPRQTFAVDEDQVRGLVDTGAGAPDLKSNPAVGAMLGKILFAPPVHDELKRERTAMWDLVIDPGCADLPFEAVNLGTSEDPWFPALENGIRRGLMLDNLPCPPPYAAKARYRMLLIADPTEDLPDAFKEAEVLKATLEKNFGSQDAAPGMDITRLFRGDATMKRVLEEVKTGSYDFIHYSGHCSFVPSSPGQSGLILSDSVLTAAELQRALTDPAPPDAHPPALVILNACRAARMTNHTSISGPPYHPATLAQAVLRSGVCAFLGNRWDVRDAAAREFALSLFTSLIHGTPLGEAVKAARRALYDSEPHRPDWVNYQFYGSMEVRL